MRIGNNGGDGSGGKGAATKVWWGDDGGLVGL